MKTLVNDNALELQTKKFRDGTSARGSFHRLFPPHSSRINSCEQTHQSIVGMSKAMMLQSGFPKPLWVDSMQTAVYLNNRTKVSKRLHKNVSPTLYQKFTV